MRKLFTPRIFLGALLGLYLGWQTGAKLANAQSQTDPLVGSWKIEIEQPDNSSAKPIKDTLTFKIDDTFTSEHFKKEGFKQGKYEPNRPRFGPAKFEGTMESEKKDAGSVKWKGSSTGQNIEGTIEYKKGDGDTISYAFKGER